jgi:hypothetical protein
VFFNPTIFWRWFFYAVWQGALLMGISFYTFDTSIENHGQMGGLTLDGNFIFAALVIIVNVKVLISSFQYTGLQIFFIAGSIISFFIVFTGFSYWIDTSVYGELEHTYL